MKIELEDRIKYVDDDEIYTVVYFNEKFVICVNSSGICNSVMDLKHDGSFNIEECLSIINELGIEFKLKFDKLHYHIIEKVTKKPKFGEIIDYPAEAFEYRGYYGTDKLLKSNAYYAYINS